MSQTLHAINDTPPVENHCTVFVYYRADSTQISACIQASQALMEKIQSQFSVKGHLMERLENGKSYTTLMESYPCKNKEQAQLLVLSLHDLVQTFFEPMLILQAPVERMTEVFVPLCTIPV